MRTILQIISWTACAATLLAPLLFLTGQMTLDQVKLSLLVTTILWFAVTSLWMGRKQGRFAAAE
jgi:apolipoprotein N-acyltransferase